MGNRQDISADKSRPFRYAAFISYAHADETAAARLHNMLEAYRPPRPHQGKGDLLRPIFRDKAELTASHSLSDEIKAAVEGSRKLLVLCSPAAKVSHWVNEEIKLFRSLHGEDAILCALVEGTPDTSFPPALLDDGREPLAADLSGGREGFRYGVLQIAASLLGIGLDDLVRRDLRRRRRIGTSVVAAALIFSGAMGASTLSAMKARAAADANRAEAEKLVEYMITDLKAKLDEVGRLEILDGVGDKVMEYYGGQSLSEMSDQRIARQARAQHLLGQVALDAGRYDEAKTQIDAAYALTKEVLKRNPDDTDAIFAHAQSAFWVGKVFKEQGQFEKIEPYWQEYYDLAYVLYNSDPNNFDWIMEAAWGEANMGIVNRELLRFDVSIENYQKSLSHLESALDINPKSLLVRNETFQTLAGLEQTELRRGSYVDAINYRRKGLRMAQQLASDNAENLGFKSQFAHGQSNFLWQYALLLTQDEKTVLQAEPLATFKGLFHHDKENVNWGRRYLWHLILIVAHAPNENSQLRAYEELMHEAEIVPPKILTPAISFYIDEHRVKHFHASGKTTKAKTVLNQMVKDYKNNHEQLASPDIILARLHAYLMEIEKSQYYAQNVIKIYKDEISAYPEARLHHAQAEVILGNCGRALELIAPIMMAAPEEAPEIAKIKSCET